VKTETESDKLINNPALLSVKDCSVNLGGNQILAGVTWDVKPGTLHALIGPNGAGKTTLIRCIMGGMPHQGEIRLRFQNHGRVGYVPQLLEFDHTLPITVGDFIAIMLKNKPIFLGKGKKVRKRAVETLKLTESDHLIDRIIGGLSGGELRRVLLAQALIPLPELLILDEAASNVDEFGARIFEDLLLRLKKEHNLTILMVSHDLTMIRRTADWVTGINRSVTFDGSSQTFCNLEKIGGLFGGAVLAGLDRREGDAQ
jgi:zinc transport system ATP-binding protein